VPYWDEQMTEVMLKGLGEPFALLLGRKTYEIFAAHWPHVSEERAARGGTAAEGDAPVAAALNGATKYVASTTLTEVTWANSVLLEGDVADAVATLKQQDGPDLQVQGSWNLIQTLLQHELIDEYRLWTFPVLVGPGKRLFADGTVPAGLELVDSATSTTGVVMATYRPAGQLTLGSFAFDDPTDEEVVRRTGLAEE
jgi:dihydrofolate reductase